MWRMEPEEAMGQLWVCLPESVIYQYQTQAWAVGIPVETGIEHALLMALASQELPWSFKDLVTTARTLKAVGMDPNEWLRASSRSIVGDAPECETCRDRWTLCEEPYDAPMSVGEPGPEEVPEDHYPIFEGECGPPMDVFEEWDGPPLDSGIVCEEPYDAPLLVDGSGYEGFIEDGPIIFEDECGPPMDSLFGGEAFSET